MMNVDDTLIRFLNAEVLILVILLKLTCDFHELKANEAARLQSGASEQGSLHLMEGDHTSYLVDMNLIPVFHCSDFR